MEKLPPLLVTAPHLSSSYSGQKPSVRRLEHNSHCVLSVKDCEKEELSAKLRTLRKELDHCTFACDSQEKQLNTLLTERELLQGRTHSRSTTQRSLFGRTEKLGNELTCCRLAQEEEKRGKETYLHLLDRTRTANVHLMSKTNELDERLHDKDSVLSAVGRRMGRSSEAKYRAQSTLASFRVTLAAEKEVCKKDLTRVAEELKTLNKSKLRKEAMRKEYQVKLEQNMIQEESAKAELLREQLFAHRLWHSLMNNALSVEERNWKQLEQAFHKITLGTGISDIKAVVGRFLTKEETLQELMRTVSNKEKALNEYRDTIEQIQVHVDLTQLQEGGTGKREKDLTEQLYFSERRLSEATQKKSNIENTYYTMKEWMKKTFNRLDSVRGTSTQLPEGCSLAQCMNLLKTEINSMVTQGKLDMQQLRRFTDSRRSDRVFTESPSTVLYTNKSNPVDRNSLNNNLD